MDTSLIVRLVVSIIASVNAACAIVGVPPLDVTEDQVYTVVSVAAMIGAWAWGFWKNNSFTKEAKQADEYLAELKAGKHFADEETPE